MKSLPNSNLTKPFYVLQRFILINEEPSLSINTNNSKRIITLKNIYNEQKCIMKVQPKNALQSKDRNILHEASFYQKLQGHIGVPLMIWSGQDFDCLVLILQELGNSIYQKLKSIKLQNTLNTRSEKLRLKDVCMIGIQMLNIIKNLHQKQHIHRNISPESFSFGTGQNIAKIFMNDLLYLKKYRAPKNSLNHIQYKQNVKIQFWTPFLSINVLKHKQPSRRDDLISIIYVLIYLLKGKLPWMQDWEQQISDFKLKINKENNSVIDLSFIDFKGFDPKMEKDIYENRCKKIQKCAKIQDSLKPEELCSGLPKQIKQILVLVSELQYTEQPEYQRYIALLNKILYKDRLKNDLLFEWMQNELMLQPKLKVSIPIPSKFQTSNEKQILDIIYTPFEQKIDMDPIGSMIQRQKTQLREGYEVKSSNQNEYFKKIQRQKLQYKRKHKKCQLI